jgi:hypothetical protein
MGILHYAEQYFWKRESTLYDRLLTLKQKIGPNGTVRRMYDFMAEVA